MSPTPTVSVIIPTYNRADKLQYAIDSVLHQTCRDFELIVVDDGSTDETQRLMSQYEPAENVRYIYQSNQGRSAARNYGGSLARGDILGFLDSDDEYLPNSLAVHLDAFAQNSDLAATLGGYQYVTDKDEIVGERRPWEEGKSPNLEGWLFNCFAVPGSVLLRRSWFERLGGFDPYCEIAEDWDLFLRLVHNDCKMAWIPQATCRYRLHAGNSIRSVSLHRQGSLRSFEKLFGQPNLSPDVAMLKNKAIAWLHVVFAKRAYAVGELKLAIEDWLEAVRLDPELGKSRKLELLEALLTPPAGRYSSAQELSQTIANHLPTGVDITAHDIRLARARTEMAQFFRLHAAGMSRQASAHLVVGVKLDPRWLTNRGVLSYAFRYWLRLR